MSTGHPAMLDWARREADGDQAHLRWVVDATQVEDKDELDDGSFPAPPLARTLPAGVVEAARAERRAGRATLLEATSTLLARPAWFVRSAPVVWTAASPRPKQIAVLVEAFGIGRALHQDDPERLARLAARIRIWLAHRGAIGPTLDLLREALQIDLGGRVLHNTLEGAEPPALQGELLALHGERYWVARAAGRPAPVHRIQDGIVRFQAPGTTAPLAVDDLLVIGADTVSQLAPVLRLLPATLVPRVVLPLTEAR